MQEIAKTVSKPEIQSELQNRLFSVLDYLGEAAKKTADIAADQLPKIAHDIVMYGAISGWIYCGIGLLLIAVAITIGTAIWRKGKEWSEEAFVFSCIGTALFFIFGLCVFCTSIDNAIKATFAPRVYLIEWVTEQVKKMN